MNSPLHTPLCDKLGIEYPIVAFTHCKDVAVAVINAGGFAVLGEALHTPDQIESDIKWIRERVAGKPFGIDLVLPSSVPGEARRPAGDDRRHRDFEQMIAKVQRARSEDRARHPPLGWTKSARWTSST
jgi:hypothetical protein